MMHFDLDTSRGAAPLYMQLADALERHISDEDLEAGTQLPSEPKLVAANGLSRATVLKAFELLVNRGVVSRRRGKGTFVRARPMERRLPELTSFSEHVEGLGLRPGNELVSFEHVASAADQRPECAFPDDVDLVVATRVRTVAEKPVGLQRLITSQHIADRAGLTEDALAQADFSFYAALRASGVRLELGEETLRAINATEDEAELLGVAPGTALIEVDRILRDQSGQLIEHVRARYLGTHYLYRVTLTHQPNGGNHETDTSDALRTGGGYAPADHGLLGER